MGSRRALDSRLFDLTRPDYSCLTQRRLRHAVVPNHVRQSHRASRRAFLKAGAAGAVALLFVRSLNAAELPDASSGRALPRAAKDIFAAIVPVLLDGALPTGAESAGARSETLRAIEDAIAGLPSAARNELADLVSLLDFAPTRCLLAGVWSPWSEASSASIAAFLDRWRESRFTLLRSAYGALHQIVFAAWYAQPRAWAAIGYAGPPVVPSA